MFIYIFSIILIIIILIVFFVLNYQKKKITINDNQYLKKVTEEDYKKIIQKFPRIEIMRNLTLTEVINQYEKVKKEYEDYISKNNPDKKKKQIKDLELKIKEFEIKLQKLQIELDDLKDKINF